MAIEDYIPNIFGGTPTVYQGLLSPQEQASLEKRANLAGLLGSVASLAQGMGGGGYPRSPTQNILTAIAQGFSGAGQTYQAGIGQLAEVQKLQQSRMQLDAINKVLQDPNVDDATKAYIRANPAEGLKLLSERSQFQRAREAYMPTPAPTAPAAPAPVEGGMPPVTVTGNPEIARLETQIQGALADAQAYSSLRRPTEAEASARLADRLRERQQQLSAAETNLDVRIQNAPESFKEQYRTLSSLRDSLKPQDFVSALQKIDADVAQSQKQYKFEGLPGNFAVRMFGTNDMTKLSPQQNDLVLRFANAPTQADQTKIVIDAQKLQFETGVGVNVPVSREQLLGGQTQPVVAPTAQAPAVAPPSVAPSVTAVSQAPAPVTTPQEARQVVKDIKTPVVDINVTPLIKQPDSKVPPKTKQDLLTKQSSSVGLASYALKNVVDARDSAEKLLSNPAYLDALTGMTAPAMKNVPGTDAYTANQLVNNLLGRAFVNELSQMRQASPTGGAVGNVAVAEMDSLSKIQSSLTVGMKKDEFIKQLKQYINVSNRAIKTIPNEYARTYGYSGEFDDLLKGTVVEQNAPAAQVPSGVKVKRVR
jgi:hypothetical protein